MKHWDEQRDSEKYVYGNDPNDFLREKLRQLKSGDALSLGEGEGQNAVFLSKGGFSVHCVDNSLATRKKAMALAKSKNVHITYELKEYGELDLSGEKFDTILLIWCQMPSDLRKVVHQKCVDALIPGGVLLLEAYGKGQLGKDSGGPDDADMLYAKDDLLEDFGALEIVSCDEKERYLGDGPARMGLSSVVQLLAKNI
jgi:SAM-dependent methyltransferase